MSLRLLLCALVLLPATLGAVLAGAQQTRARDSARAPADVVLLGGKVITVDSADRIAQAVAVRAGKIVAVGSDAEIRALVGPRTRTIALSGRTVTPGLLDAHAHFANEGADRFAVIDVAYPTVKSVADVAAAVAERAKVGAPDAWVEGGGWDEGKLAERRLLAARPRRGRGYAPRLSDAHHGALRRRQQHRLAPGGDHQGHA